MIFLRNHREKLLSALAIVGATLIINSDRLFFSDERPLRWSKEYTVTGTQTNLDETMEVIRDDAFDAMRGSWSGAKSRPVHLIKVELRGGKP